MFTLKGIFKKMLRFSPKEILKSMMEVQIETVFLWALRGTRDPRRSCDCQVSPLSELYSFPLFLNAWDSTFLTH